jgi:hypothetical protein
LPAAQRLAGRRDAFAIIDVDPALRSDAAFVRSLGAP